MINSTQAFLGPVEQWARAIREDDFPAARRWAQRLAREGEKLAQHPDFKKCFMVRCGGFDTHEALVHLSQFLMCATEGRAMALGRGPSAPATGQGPGTSAP